MLCIEASRDRALFGATLLRDDLPSFLLSWPKGNKALAINSAAAGLLQRHSHSLFYVLSHICTNSDSGKLGQRKKGLLGEGSNLSPALFLLLSLLKAKGMIKGVRNCRETHI